MTEKVDVQVHAFKLGPSWSIDVMLRRGRWRSLIATRLLLDGVILRALDTKVVWNRKADATFAECIASTKSLTDDAVTANTKLDQAWKAV